MPYHHCKVVVTREEFISATSSYSLLSIDQGLGHEALSRYMIFEVQDSLFFLINRRHTASIIVLALAPNLTSKALYDGLSMYFKELDKKFYGEF